MSQTPQHSSQNLLQAFADGELSAADAERLAMLLQADMAAAAEVAAVHEIGDRIRSAPLPMPSANAELRWMRNWQIARDRSVRRLASWMTAAASIILAITLSTAVGRPARAQAQPALADWETAAVAGVDDDEAPRAARLIAVDLSLPQTGEGVQ